MSPTVPIMCLIIVLHLGCLRGFEKNDAKIIGGFPAKRGEFPFVVKITGNLACGASLVTLSKIITAGHCFVYTNRSGHTEYIDLTLSRVIGGVLDWRNTRDEYYQSTSIADYKLHPEYSYRNCGPPIHDISVANLTQSFHFSPTVRPMSIISDDPDVFRYAWDCLVIVGTTCVSVGWGMTSFNLTQNGTMVPIIASRFLKAITLRPIRGEICRIEDDCYFDEDASITGEVCVFSLYRNQALSKGDSGGPLICEGNVYAVLSSAVLDPTFKSPNHFFLLWKYLEDFGLSLNDSCPDCSPNVDKSCSPKNVHLIWIYLLLFLH